MSNLGLLDVADLLDGHQLVVQLAQEDGSLSPAAEPQEIGDVFERDVPVVCRRMSSTSKSVAFVNRLSN